MRRSRRQRAEPPARQASEGPGSRGDALRPYFDNGARITPQLRKIHQVGDIAVLSSTTIVTGFAAEPVVNATTEVVRRQLDGRWLYVVDEPFFGA